MKKLWIMAVVALVIIAGGLAVWLPKKNTTSTTTRASSQTQSSMSAMQTQFEGYKGTEYDKVFLAGMITHHEGAVQMAQIALTSAKHQKIKDMANNIISDQNKEITQMQAWQTAWGYNTRGTATNVIDKQMQDERRKLV